MLNLKKKYKKKHPSICLYSNATSALKLFCLSKENHFQYSYFSLNCLKAYSMLKYFQVQGETLHTVGPDIFKDTDDTGSTASWRFYSHPSVWRPTLVCFAIMFFFQATGFNTIIANTALIFKESKIPIDEHVASGVTGGVILISCAVALVLSRLLPRKMLLLTSSTGTRYCR